jgi:acetyl-CoA acetyltransferase
MAKALKNTLAIVGAGILAGHYLERSGRMLQAEAARMAIADAGLEVRDVDGAIDVLLIPGAGNVPAYTDAFPRVLGMPCRFFAQMGRGGVGAIMSLVAAAKFLEIGAANYIVLACGTKDWSRSREAKQQNAAGNRTIEKKGYWGRPFGDLIAPSHHGFFAQRHMHEYGTTPEQFGHIAVAARSWAQANPMAQHYGKPITLDDYLASPMLIWPYRLLDMCSNSDGGAAIVLTTMERAKDCRKPPIAVLGAGFGEAMEQLWWDKANYTRLAVETAKATAFREADVTIDDVDVAGLYDCFTGEVLFQIEDYGWCAKGEGGPFAEAGHIAPGGKVALNTSGGLLSAYHLGEWTHMIEVVQQLWGECGSRQVADAEIGLVSGHGGEIISPGMCSTHGSLVLGRT